MTQATKKPFATTLDVGSSLANHTGSWRTSRPTYVDRLPPCNEACPAGENIQRWLFHAESGDYRRAWEQIMEDNPFPAVMGRACYHRCEGSCNRGKLDEAVSIHAVERFLGDLAIRERWFVAPTRPSTGKRVLVIGAGPSGLAAAYHLRRLGHEVEIREAGPLPGGMLRFGIPSYRLPRPVLDAEIARITVMGVKLMLDAKVTDIPTAMREGSFDACFAAIGAHLAKRVDIPAPDAGKILDALTLLRGMEAANPPRIGRRVVVYGGGNTAIDAARTVKRLGADPVIVYRRTQAQMPAHPSELEDALQEGVAVHWLSTIRHMNETSLTVEKMALDDKGWPQPTGELETLEGDTLVLALGQDVDLGTLTSVPGVNVTREGTVHVSPDMMTGFPGLFCGGDMVDARDGSAKGTAPAERNMTVAVGHGKKAARAIDAYLRGDKVSPRSKPEVATFEKLNTWYYSDADATLQPLLDQARRLTTFDEVVGGLDASNALFEARRCLSCGNCFECDNCYGVCPDNAVIKLGPGQRFKINEDFCKGCGLCAAECPCGAIEMVPEDV